MAVLVRPPVLAVTQMAAPVGSVRATPFVANRRALSLSLSLFFSPSLSLFFS